jgi:hypothetical protein
VAERRDLIVATYSLDCATGDIDTVTVCTGNPCIWGGAAACFFWQPVAYSARKNKELNVRMRSNPMDFTSIFPLSRSNFGYEQASGALDPRGR